MKKYYEGQQLWLKMRIQYSMSVFSNLGLLKTKCNALGKLGYEVSGYYDAPEGLYLIARKVRV